MLLTSGGRRPDRLLESYRVQTSPTTNIKGAGAENPDCLLQKRGPPGW